MGFEYIDDVKDAPAPAGKFVYEERRAPASDTAVALNAANKGMAGLPDMILNAPNNLLNLGRAAVGTVAGMAGRPDLMPDLVPNPDLARRGMESVGAINPNIRPDGMWQKALDYGIQGAVGGALTGGAGLARSAVGAGMGAMSGLAAGGTQEATGNPALAAVAGMAPMIPGAMRNPKIDASLKSQNSVKDETLAMAKEAGYVVPPSAVEGSWLGNRIEGIAGKAALNQEANLRNQPVTNRIARNEAGLAPDEPISTSTLAAARNKIAEPYREVAALNPMAAKALELLNQSRLDAKDYWTEYKRQGSVAAKKQAESFDKKSEMYETVIEKIAARKGDPDLLDRLREARVNLAKNFDVERALNVGSGDVDAQVIGRMYDRNPNKYTGGLEVIGRFSNAFKPWTRDAAVVPAPGVSKLEALASVGLGMGGHAAGMGWLPMGLPLLAGPARSLALSPMMQGGRSYEPGILSQAAQQTSPIVTGGTLADILRNQQSR